MMIDKRFAEWKRKERMLNNFSDTFMPVDIQEMMAEIERLRVFEALAKETGIFP